VLYDVSPSYMEGRCCPLAKRGYSQNGRKGTLQITYGLLCASDGSRSQSSIRRRHHRSGDAGAADDKLKQHFRLDRVVLVGDRGMLTQARISEEIKLAGLDWITALRAPAIKALLESGSLQLSLFDQQQVFRWNNGNNPRQYGLDFGLWTRTTVAEQRGRRT
jgi:hypothetical protein